MKKQENWVNGKKTKQKRRMKDGRGMKKKTVKKTGKWLFAF